MLSLIVLVSITRTNARDVYFGLKVTGNRTFSLEVKNVVGNAQVKILDEDGKSIFSELHKNAGKIQKRYDVSQLPLGHYLLEYTDDFKSQTMVMKVDDSLKFDLENVKTRFIPVVQQKGKVMNIGVPCLGYGDLQVIVYNSEGALMIDRKISGEDFLGQRLNFSRAIRGTYKVIIRTNGHTHYRNIRI